MEINNYTKMDIFTIIDRIETEAENPEEMAKMIKAEIDAYAELVREKEPFNIDMYRVVQEFPNADYVAVGGIYLTEEDYEDDIYGYIIPYSYIEKGIYTVKYKILYLAEI